MLSLPPLDVFIEDGEEKGEADSNNDVAHSCTHGECCREVFSEDVVDAVDSQEAHGPCGSKVVYPEECGESWVVVDAEYKDEN